MKPLTLELQTKLYQLIELLENITPIGRLTLEGFPIDHFKDPMYIRVNLFHRYINRIEVMIPLMKKWEQNPDIEDSIGIIMRACLVDVISQFYLEDIHSKVNTCPSIEETEYLQVAKDLLADHLFSGMKYLKTLKDDKVYTNEYYKESIDEWIKLYPFYFKDEQIDYDNPTKSILARAYPTPSKILKHIRQSELFKRHNPDQLYIIYFYYSKYEHFGATTNSIQTHDMNIIFYFMMDSLTYILLACLLCCGHFEHAYAKANDGFAEYFKKINLIREEFVRIVNINHLD